MEQINPDSQDYTKILSHVKGPNPEKLQKDKGLTVVKEENFEPIKAPKVTGSFNGWACHEMVELRTLLTNLRDSKPANQSVAGPWFMKNANQKKFERSKAFKKGEMEDHLQI